MTLQGIDRTRAVVRVLTAKSVSTVVLDGKPVAPSEYVQSGRTLLLHFLNCAEPQAIVVRL